MKEKKQAQRHESMVSEQLTTTHCARWMLSSGGGSSRRVGEISQSDLGGVLLCVVEILAVVPETGGEARALDGDPARPCSATAYDTLNG